MGSLMLVSGSPVGQSTAGLTQVLPTGAAAVTAHPPVPTFGTVPAEQPDAAAALGDSNLRNYCSFPVYVYVCNEQGCAAEFTINSGGSWSAPISGTTGDGVSIKIGTTAGEVQKPILQLEYTNQNGLIYFDASQVNGNPFGSYGYTLTDNVGLSAHCPPPCTHAACPFVFNTPTDGTVYNIPNSDSIGMTLCG
ncbi:hypothetical protein P7C71_g5589, partial [Lecanoromycetidae sp. Uapishka_2]